MHQSFVTTAPHTYGEGWGIAMLKCRAITFHFSSVHSVQGKRLGFDIRILKPGRFSIAKSWAKSKGLTSSLPPGGGAHSRAMKAENS